MTVRPVRPGCVCMVRKVNGEVALEVDRFCRLWTYLLTSHIEYFRYRFDSR